MGDILIFYGWFRQIEQICGRYRVSVIVRSMLPMMLMVLATTAQILLAPVAPALASSPWRTTIALACGPVPPRWAGQAARTARIPGIDGTRVGRPVGRHRLIAACTPPLVGGIGPQADTMVPSHDGAGNRIEAPFPHPHRVKRRYSRPFHPPCWPARTAGLRAP